jgi:FAD/FMN-containing dehydrogenase
MSFRGSSQTWTTRRGLLKSAAGIAAAAVLPQALARAALAFDNQSSLLADLARKLSGRLLKPTDADYLAWAVSANTRFDSVLPLAAVLCADEADVRHAIVAANQAGIQLAARGGGHNYLGMSSTAGLLIVTRGMRRIDVNAATGEAVIEAGVVGGELLRALRAGRWVLPIGTCPHVGVSGLTLGGGVGDNARWAGLTCDHLTATRAVDASGSRLLIDSSNNPDLFWACQGAGGGNFCLHTSLSFQLLPTPARVAWFAMEFAGRDATARACSALAKIMHAAPDAFSAFTLLRSSPRPGQPDAGPWQLDPAAFPNAEIVGSFLGADGDLRDLVAPLMALRPADSLFDSGDFWQAQDWLAVPPALRSGWADVNRYMTRPLTDADIGEMVDLLVKAPFGREDRYVDFGLFGWAGGAVRKRAPADSAYVHRDAASMLRAGAHWSIGVPLADQILLNEWLDTAYDFIRRIGAPASYVNWPNERIADWPQAYYGANLARLVEVKRRYDPRNVFASAQSISLS